MQEILENPFSTHLLITAVIILIGFVVVRLSHRVSRRFLDDPERIYRSTKSTRRTVAFLAIIAIAIVWSPGFGDLLTLITVIGAGLAIALREVLLSIGGWARISLMTSFREGDRIEINGIRGDVIDIRVLRTTLMEIGGWVDADQSTGR
ncbi:MAG: mechanosensitive ion channel, partial [Bacteroidetes bacterium]|nr:mechanosensitive ion channel [Bacteroidota bacterium]